MACAAPKQDKAAIRKMVFRLRNGLAGNEVKQLSRRIEEILFSCDEFLDRQRILYYLSFDKEVSTYSMISRSLMLQKRVYVPRVNKSVKKIEICEIKNLEADMELNDFGIREPVHVPVEPHQKIDAVVAPGLAFDHSGARIGFGGGYYDKFLEKTKAIKVGLTFTKNLVDRLFTNHWDIPMDVIISEKGIIRDNKESIDKCWEWKEKF